MRPSSLEEIINPLVIADHGNVDIPNLSADDVSRLLQREDFDAANSLDTLQILIGEGLVTTADTLPQHGFSSRTVWPGPYWPSYLNCVDFDWSGTNTSAVLKYAAAFGIGPDLQSAASSTCGWAKSGYVSGCATDSDCDDLKVPDAVCIDPGDGEPGVCIPKWYGLCHAWSAGATQLNEPQVNVVMNGVTFNVLDIKALLATTWDFTSHNTLASIQVGARCEKELGPDLGQDVWGRYDSPECRDLNPGILFLAATNLLGTQDKPFIFDLEALSQVWNYPAYGYNISTYYSISLNDAIGLLRNNTPPSAELPFSPSASDFRYVELDLYYKVESELTQDGPLADVSAYNYFLRNKFVLELDNSGSVVGGEYVGDSKLIHPDFLWIVTQKYSGTVADSTPVGTGIAWQNVQQLVALSQSS